ncbi:MAG: sensor histidine kinase [Candidatus Hodarchaeota archaeon]
MNKKELEEIELLRFAISHEIRGAITIAKGYSEFARKGKFGPLNSKLTKAFESIERIADRMTAVTGNLNEFLRFRFQRAVIIKKQIQNAAFFEAVIQNVRLEAQKKNISIKSQLSENLSFWADEKALQLVTINLLRNALQFSSQGTFVKVKIESPQNELFLSVEDEGTGLSASDIDKIWVQPEGIQPEFGKKGSCLGLRISRMLIEQHNGTLEVTSDGKGKGTQAIIRIPH